MLETKCVGYNFEVSVMVLAILVAKIEKMPLKSIFCHSIKSPRSTCHQVLNFVVVINILSSWMRRKKAIGVFRNGYDLDK